MTTIQYSANEKPTTLKREAVEKTRAALVVDAVRYENARGVSAADREMGLTWADKQETARAYRADAERLTQVLACIDAGVAELPRNLYPR